MRDPRVFVIVGAGLAGAKAAVWDVAEPIKELMHTARRVDLVDVAQSATVAAPVSR